MRNNNREPYTIKGVIAATTSGTIIALAYFLALLLSVKIQEISDSDQIDQASANLFAGAITVFLLTTLFSPLKKEIEYGISKCTGNSSSSIANSQNSDIEAQTNEVSDEEIKTANICRHTIIGLIRSGHLQDLQGQYDKDIATDGRQASSSGIFDKPQRARTDHAAQAPPTPRQVQRGSADAE